jgi:threonine/homoserine/homoserine lactone efflux protein
MIDVIGEFLPQAIAAALSPTLIIALLVILSTANARTNGPMFLLGSFVGTLALVSVVVLLGSGQDYSEDSDPRVITSLLTLLLGVGLLYFAYTQWKSRPRAGEEVETPGWLQGLDKFSPIQTFGIAFLISALNTKNTPIAVGVGISIAQAGLDNSSSLIVILVFAIIAASALAVPLVIYFGFSDRAEKILGDMRNWLTANSNVIMAVLFLVIGANLAGNGLAGLF